MRFNTYKIFIQVLNITYQWW